MAYELRDGQGSLFKNDKKGNEKAPDYKGTAKLGGEMYDLAGWIKKGSQSSFLSVSIQKKGERQERPAAAATERPRSQGQSIDEMESDIPF